LKHSAPSSNTKEILFLTLPAHWLQASSLMSIRAHSSTSAQALWQEERSHLEAELLERITLDALTGDNGSESRHLTDDAGGSAGWLIAQRKKGHRHSADDVLTAWYALQNSPSVTEHLDLGTGIGTVGLLTLWGMGASARLTCVEAQEVSYRLLLSNLRANELNERVESLHGDLRDLSLGKTFPLVTGSPPYFPEGTGVIPLDSQKAHARFELRGDVSDYARAAVKHLAPGGWFIFCFPTPQKQRALDGVIAAGLQTVRVRDVIPRDTLEPLFSLFACQHRNDTSHDCIQETPFVIRLECGRLSEEMAAVRRGFGFLDGEAHGGYGLK
jgi:tRNA1Val (adenine37-N6)-methyltransferase